MKTQEILNIIREKAGLKRLELVSCDNHEDKVMDVGEPAQLNDLLRVVAGKVVIRLYSECLVFENNYESIKYDLTKSVEQNLEKDSNLRKLIGNLLK